MLNNEREFSNSLNEACFKGIFSQRSSTLCHTSFPPFFPTMSEWWKKPLYVGCQPLTYSPRLKAVDNVGIGIILNYQGQQKYFQTGFATPEFL